MTVVRVVDDVMEYNNNNNNNKYDDNFDNPILAQAALASEATTLALSKAKTLALSAAVVQEPERVQPIRAA